MQAVETLVELSKDSLDMIAWALSELLDRLAKVRPIYSVDDRPQFQRVSVFSKSMHTRGISL